MKSPTNFDNTFKQKNFHRGFTLMEIIIVVIVLGVIASLALSNYKTIVEQNHCRNAQMNLLLMHSAGVIYISKYGPPPAPPGFGANLAALQSSLKISIPADPNFDYQDNNILGFANLRATRKNGPSYNCEVSFASKLSTTNPLCTDLSYCQPVISP